MSSTVTSPAWKKAGNTDRWTEILFRALASRVAKRWRFVSFRGAGGGEWRGIVDVLAMVVEEMHRDVSGRHDVVAAFVLDKEARPCGVEMVRAIFSGPA